MDFGQAFFKLIDNIQGRSISCFSDININRSFSINQGITRGDISTIFYGCHIPNVYIVYRVFKDWNFPQFFYFLYRIVCRCQIVFVTYIHISGRRGDVISTDCFNNLLRRQVVRPQFVRIYVYFDCPWASAKRWSGCQSRYLY
ncbi:hypothetical protein D3C72_1272840 [compost metagenome]